MAQLRRLSDKIRIPLTTTEGLTIVSMLVTAAIAWGTLSSRVNAQDRLLEPVPGLITKQAVMDVKLDYLIGLLEYRYGLRNSQPERPKRLSR